MNIQRIRERIENGFKPFTIHMSDGRRFPVPHTDYVALGKKVVAVVGKNDQVHTLDPLHITALAERLTHK